MREAAAVKRGVLHRTVLTSIGDLYSSLFAEPLVRPGDAADDALRALVERAVVVLPQGAQPLRREDVDLAQYDHHGNFVDDLVSELLRSNIRHGNVLCKGLRLAISADVNSARSVVRGRAWEQLHERIGSQLMRYLLRETSVFVALPNRGYMQVCGRALHEARQQQQRPQQLLKPIRRARMLYDERFVRKVGLGPSHVLSSGMSTPHKRFARTLVKHVFGGARGSTWRIPKHLRVLVAPMVQLTRNHQRLRYGHWLRVHCTITATEAPTDSSSSEELTLDDVFGPQLPSSYKELIVGFTSQRCVCKFVMACLRRLVPAVVWGSNDNLALTAQMVDALVCARRYEEFDVDAWTDRWHTSACVWLPHHKTAAIQRRRMVRAWLHWLVADVMIPLVRNHFYVTESALYRNKLFYFRKPLWRKIAKTVQLGDMYRPVDEVEAQELLGNRFGLPCARLRFVPKASGMRPIVNLSAQDAGFDSTNQLLRPIYEALRWELLQGGGKAHLLGASVFNLNDAYHKLLPFILRWRANPNQLLYFVSVDVKQSFDSVNQRKLCDILFDERERIFSHERYVLQRYAVHVPRMDTVTTAWRNIVTPAAQVQPLNVAMGDNMPRKSVLVDAASQVTVERPYMEAILRHHITRNMIRVGKSYYVQHVGIPQGSVLSSLLCSLFYGHMERHGLADLVERADSVLVRFIDDSLFTSTSEAVATEFLHRLSTRFVDDYGTQLNANKTQVNFVCGTMPRVQCDTAFPSANPCLAWCGVLIDTVTLEVFGDYSRYRGNYVNDSLTMSGSAASLGQKIKRFAQPKCVPLLLDVRINRPAIVQLNVYQIFLLCAIKFHCHVRCLPHHDNQRFLFGVVAEVVDFTNALVQSRLHVEHCSTEHVTPNCVRYLGYHAFWSVLQRKQSVYPVVMEMLREQMARDDYRGVAARVAAVVDAERTALFCAGILY